MSPALPLVSIIIPTHNRPTQLRMCLESLTRLDYPRDRFEVIVVDDGSPARLDSTIDPLRERLNVTLIRQARAGPATARNAGAARAGGTLLAFTDDDCAPDPGWLRALATRLIDAPDAMVGGQTINALRHNLYAAASQLLVAYLYEYYTVAGQPRFFTSNNVAIATDGFRALGGFDTGYPLAAAEDRDFCERWLERGGRMIHAPEAIVRHAHALTLRSFWRQHLRYGRGAYRFHARRAHRRQESLRVEPLRFYVDLLRYPLTQRRGWRALALAALLGLSQGANALGYAVERAATRRGRAM